MVWTKNRGNSRWFKKVIKRPLSDGAERYIRLTSEITLRLAIQV